MNNNLIHNEWKIIETEFTAENQCGSESIFSIGNGKMGQRANFEEKYSGESLQGSYVAGVYYPDKTRVGWWKNGYPEYFAKVLNSPNWIGIDIVVDDVELDLAKCKVSEFNRTLDMQHGILERSFIATLEGDKQIKVVAQRFVSIVDDEIGLIKYQVTPLNFDGVIKVSPYIDTDVRNEDSNYDEDFWLPVNNSVSDIVSQISVKTKKLDFVVSAAMRYDLFLNQNRYESEIKTTESKRFVGNSQSVNCKQNDTVSVYKYVSVLSNLNHKPEVISENAIKVLNSAYTKGYDKLLSEHKNAWLDKWKTSDIKIEGDIPAQQGIRFNIFQLNQTYTGTDSRLNVGPKGFTGEKYGGSTYWDTEAYCIPFFLSTSPQDVSRNLLKYRHNHLNRAIENAGKLGFNNGAALYPMVTMNGEECHNEWEITFEEIHRNGAIAYGIYNYINYTGDKEYLALYGLEVLIGIARFWAQRVSFSAQKNKYVMLGVTGPNEYDNNVDNNWYTNTLAQWCMKYAIESYTFVKETTSEQYNKVMKTTKFDESEIADWEKIINNMYFPEDINRGIFLQQDNYLDKELKTVADLKPEEKPINQHWSWDRILRSCYIKQADVLQGLFFFEDRYDHDTLKRNYDFYEPRTVHESSLSPCVYSIMASKIGYAEDAYKLYLRTSRLDLDDYNKEVHEGLHITSMAGTWMSVVYGFGGMRVKDNKLVFNPSTPANWKSYSFKVNFRKNIIDIKISDNSITIKNDSDGDLTINILNKDYTIAGNSTTEITLK